ncbi:zinc ABC transporter substrate-binding protein [Candidatus Uhrbacteria bacterium]|nr:zinc ABC transporter substrate-binding protein [Candidatus Uhrbacteria bacterium]
MRTRVFLIAVLLLIAASLGLTALVNRSEPEDARPRVATSMFPVYDIVRTVAGDRLNVVMLMPPGANPHTFEPTPDTVAQLEGAEVLYTIGYGVDDWTKSIINALTDMTTLSADIPLRIDEDGNVDPHYWLTIENAKRMAELAEKDLSGRFPEYAQVFRANLGAYLGRLNDTQAEIERLMSQVENTHIITQHDAWYYFADAYGLDIIGTYEPSSGREPTPEDLATLAETMAEYEVTTLYVDAGESEAAVEAFATDHNLTLVTLDAEGTSGEYETYIDLILGNARRISENQ